MSKSRTLTHDERERIKADYMQAFRMVNGEAVAAHLVITYRKGWWYFNQKDYAPGLSTPYRASQVEQMTLNLRKKIPARADQEEDSFD
jgi:hypothetical protein